MVPTSHSSGQVMGIRSRWREGGREGGRTRYLSEGKYVRYERYQCHNDGPEADEGREGGRK